MLYLEIDPFSKRASIWVNSTTVTIATGTCLIANITVPYTNVTDLIPNSYYNLAHFDPTGFGNITRT